MIRPARLRLSHTKGFDLQAHSRAINGLDAVFVARKSKWGNPFRIGAGYQDDAGNFAIIDRDTAVRLFRRYWDQMLNDPGTIHVSAIEVLEELRGKNLACWCPLDGHPCHADVLLEIANR